MKTGELCESCGRFSEGRDHVVECSICKKDMCNYCANLQACDKCFSYYDYGDSITIGDKTYKYIIEKGEEIGTWKLNDPKCLPTIWPYT